VLELFSFSMFFEILLLIVELKKITGKIDKRMEKM
jgi:hypothetical protein